MGIMQGVGEGPNHLAWHVTGPSSLPDTPGVAQPPAALSSWRPSAQACPQTGQGRTDGGVGTVGSPQRSRFCPHPPEGLRRPP